MVGNLVEVLVALVTKHIITIIHMQLAVMDDAGRVELDSIVVTSTGQHIMVDLSNTLKVIELVDVEVF